jgi:starch synthase
MDAMTDPINILFLSAEAEPFIKVGGLADVAGALPLALRSLPVGAQEGYSLDVRLILPLHRAIRSQNINFRSTAEFTIIRSGAELPVQVFETMHAGMPVYFVDGPPISAAPTVYSADQAADRDKYTFFSLAVLELLKHLDWQPAIIHANDWHTALVLYALRSKQNDLQSENIRTMMTIHNLAYMGNDGSDVLSAYGLEPFDKDGLPEWAQTQALPLGLSCADAIVPVSPTYGREILTEEFGCGLEDFLKLRNRDINGILNGLDTDAWNPETDPELPVCFNADRLPVRKANKTALQKRLGLDEIQAPLIGMVGRIDQQKGLDIAFETLRQMGDLDWQFVMLGSGDAILENEARALQEHFPDRVRISLGFDAGLSRWIYGGADMFLMPSRYEPCGLAQMIAMRYGCVPIVHATGGLKDTVHEAKTGFLFKDAEPESLAEALQRAFIFYRSPLLWQQFQSNCMKKDFSWPRPARRYARLYRALLTGD